MLFLYLNVYVECFVYYADDCVETVGVKVGGERMIHVIAMETDLVIVGQVAENLTQWSVIEMKLMRCPRHLVACSHDNLRLFCAGVEACSLPCPDIYRACGVAVA